MFVSGKLTPFPTVSCKRAFWNWTKCHRPKTFPHTSCMRTCKHLFNDTWCNCTQEWIIQESDNGTMQHSEEETRFIRRKSPGVSFFHGWAYNNNNNNNRNWWGIVFTLVKSVCCQCWLLRVHTSKTNLKKKRIRSLKNLTGRGEEEGHKSFGTDRNLTHDYQKFPPPSPPHPTMSSKIAPGQLAITAANG